jgi:hypothetical protein
MGGFWAKHKDLILGAIELTLGEHIDNLGNNLGEHGRNTLTTHEKKNLSPLPLAPKTQIKKLGCLNGCYTFPLAACNFYFQNC